MLKSSTIEKEERARRLDGAEAGERVTLEELDGLTRAFADRYGGLIYSVCDALQEDNPDSEQRRAAQMLLVDNATNVYNIASNADAFTRVLDLVVVTTLVSQVWEDDGTPARIARVEKRDARGECFGRRTDHDGGRSEPGCDECIFLARLRIAGCAIRDAHLVPSNFTPAHAESGKAADCR